ncbi:phosphatase PAP2 family protein [Erysipelothrix urinaevulpis]|uniref:phosphatase PAP2 family protein n=1 Tax=Erysipelothrix urinaevulpis TaxID=2683717 RepID=UPI00135CF304|nr:phosphatase PAP2 family protein [Erysipelothrix urinaevulpis]
MELQILDLIQTWRNPLLDIFFTVLTRMGDHAEIWLLLIFIMWMKKERRQTASLAVVSIIIELIVVSLILKPIFMRPRPFLVSDIALLIPEPFGASFPSGHAASSFAVAYFLYRENASYKHWIMTIAILMSFSRLYVYVHYPSDVIVGALIGIGIGEFVHRKRDTFIHLINAVLKKINLEKFEI